MVMPGIGEVFVPTRVRLFVALIVSYVLYPIISPKLPEIPDSGIAISMLVAAEIITGVMIGGLARLLQSVMHIAGMIMAFLSSLAAAQLFDATQGSQGSVFGNFLTIMAIVLFFASDLHHLMLSGMAGSYDLFLPGKMIPMGDFSVLASTMLSKAFIVGFQIAAPQILVGLTMYLAAGVMGRLMPAMQVFFILVPIQILVSFYVLMVTLSVGMMVYLNHFTDSLTNIFYP